MTHNTQHTTSLRGRQEPVALHTALHRLPGQLTAGGHRVLSLSLLLHPANLPGQLHALALALTALALALAALTLALAALALALAALALALAALAQATLALALATLTLATLALTADPLAALQLL